MTFVNPRQLKQSNAWLPKDMLLILRAIAQTTAMAIILLICVIVFGEARSLNQFLSGIFPDRVGYLLTRH
jgi:hypothetical protein